MLACSSVGGCEWDCRDKWEFRSEVSVILSSLVVESTLGRDSGQRSIGLWLARAPTVIVIFALGSAATSYGSLAAVTCGANVLCMFAKQETLQSSRGISSDVRLAASHHQRTSSPRDCIYLLSFAWLNTVCPACDDGCLLCVGFSCCLIRQLRTVNCQTNTPCVGSDGERHAKQSRYQLRCKVDTKPSQTPSNPRSHRGYR